jgi:hypothetical protein
MINEESITNLNKVINAFTVYKFIKSMTLPFKSMDAYKLGIIDSKGNFLKKQEDLKTDKEKQASNMLNRLIINLKKIIMKVPDPKMQALLKHVTTAMFLIKEEAEKIGADGDYVLNEVKNFLLQKGVDIDNVDINSSFEDKFNV